MSRGLPAWLENIDRRLIYLFVAVSLAIPLLLDWTLPPAPMRSADDAYATVQALTPQPGKLVLIAADWGPGTQAENQPQTMALIEHLMRRRVPFGLISIYAFSVPFLQEMPHEAARRLARELPGQRWEYGRDWVNLGFQPGGAIMIQSLAKTADLQTLLKSDADGTPLNEIPCLQGVQTIRDIVLFAQFTGLVGVFSSWVQFFQSAEYRPPFLHGCTSITIPEAYIYYVSGQIKGLLEGAAGAARYDALLSRLAPQRAPGTAVRINTSLAVAQLLIIALIIFANAGVLVSYLRRGRDDDR